ncbi:MAG TPA: DUF4956 domain-containing protein [Pyrinomonadaceae bacterium]|jgi:uncharacterized membrane protein YhiD involved in acid resistance
MPQLDTKKKRELLTLVVVFVLVLGVSMLVVYLIAGRTAQNEAARQTAPSTVNETTPQPRPSVPAATANEPFFDRLFGVPQSEAHLIKGESWLEIVAKITLRLVLAALLGTALALRPRRRLLIVKRNPYVSQTQILLAIVAAALMIIVGDNAARAFGIFAAVSVVRFRTNIRDPKEITVLLISLAVGLAAGVGRWDLAIILTVFSLLVLWILEYREVAEVSRTMDLKLKTGNVTATQAVLREIFARHGFEAELRGIERENGDGTPGSLIYSVDVSPMVTTDKLSEEILAGDSVHVASIEWEQKKSFSSYIYQ